MNIHVQCYSPSFWSVQKVLTWRNNAGSEHQVPQRGNGVDMSTAHRHHHVNHNNNHHHSHTTPRPSRSRNISGEITLRRSGSVTDRPSTAGTSRSMVSRSNSRPRNLPNGLSIGMGASVDFIEKMEKKKEKQKKKAMKKAQKIEREKNKLENPDSNYNSDSEISSVSSSESSDISNLTKYQIQRRSSLKLSYHEKKTSPYHVNCIPDIFNDMAYSHLDHNHKDGGKCCREEDYKCFKKISIFNPGIFKFVTNLDIFF